MREVKQHCGAKSDFITRYHRSFVEDQELWVIMECLKASVADVLPLTEETAALVLKNTLSGLSYIHGNKAIHRDIKAENILLATDGTAKLADFGVTAQLTQTMAYR